MDSTDDNKRLIAETAFKAWKAAKSLESLLWESFYQDFEELFEIENLKSEKNNGKILPQELYPF
jgi:hypothetical protein